MAAVNTEALLYYAMPSAIQVGLGAVLQSANGQLSYLGRMDLLQMSHLDRHELLRHWIHPEQRKRSLAKQEWFLNQLTPEIRRGIEALPTSVVHEICNLWMTASTPPPVHIVLRIMQRRQMPKYPSIRFAPLFEESDSLYEEACEVRHTPENPYIPAEMFQSSQKLLDLEAALEDKVNAHPIVHPNSTVLPTQVSDFNLEGAGPVQLKELLKYFKKEKQKLYLASPHLATGIEERTRGLIQFRCRILTMEELLIYVHQESLFPEPTFEYLMNLRHTIMPDPDYPVTMQQLCARIFAVHKLIEHKKRISELWLLRYKEDIYTRRMQKLHGAPIFQDTRQTPIWMMDKQKPIQPPDPPPPLEALKIVPEDIHEIRQRFPGLADWPDERLQPAAVAKKRYEWYEGYQSRKRKAGETSQGASKKANTQNVRPQTQIFKMAGADLQRSGTIDPRSLVSNPQNSPLPSIATRKMYGFGYKGPTLPDIPNKHQKRTAKATHIQK